ncbi:MAG: serine hydrolase, partial [Fibrobacteria bacterium]
MPEFQGITDKEETFQIKSMLLDAGWLDKEGHVGGTATLEVRTLYVAHGSDIKVVLKDKEGKTLDSISGSVYAELFRKKIPLTVAYAPGVYFEVELPDHGLKALGRKLAVKPAIRLYDPTWKDKATGAAVSKVTRGMDLLVEVKTEGLAEGDDARLTFKEKRVAPDREGGGLDIISIPTQVKDKKIALTWRFEYTADTYEHVSTDEKKRTDEHYAPPKIFFEAFSCGAVVNGPEADFLDFVVVEVSDSAGNAVPDQKVKLTLPDGTTREATSDSEGLVTVAETKPGRVGVELLNEDPPPEEPPRAAAKPQGPAPTPFVLTTSPWPAKAIVMNMAAGGRLSTCLLPKLNADPVIKKAIADKRVHIAVVDLMKPGYDYFGINDELQWNSASLAKVCAMSAAFYLRAAVKAAAAEIASKSSQVDPADGKALFALILKTWGPKIKAKFPRQPFTAPKFGNIFTAAKTGSGWDISFTSKGGADRDIVDKAHNINSKINALGFQERMYLMAAHSDNYAASTCITDLGFNYLNGAMQDLGFYDGAKAGFWTRSTYNGSTWGPSVPSGHAKTVCRFFAALTEGSMVDAAASAEMLKLLEKLPDATGT